MSELSSGVHLLWPTPIGIYRIDQPEQINSRLLREFASIRAAQERQRGVPAGLPFFASDDDLLQRVKGPEWTRLVQFIVNSIAQTVEQVNSNHWAGRVKELTVSLEGVWFQSATHGASHDVHTHGN